MLAQITIRDATATDIAAIAALGSRFHVEAGWDDIADYSESDCLTALTGLADSENVVMIVADAGENIVGMACGISMPLYFNHAHWHGQELFFWVDPAARGKVGGQLFDAFEMAMANIAQSLSMVALDKVKPELTGRLYARRGYRPSEHYWIKGL